MKKPNSANKPVRRPKQKFPPGWNEKRVREVIAYYDSQIEDEELAEYEEGINLEDLTVMLVPRDLAPEVRELISRRRGA
jgi:hypothetical protein